MPLILKILSIKRKLISFLLFNSNFLFFNLNSTLFLFNPNRSLLKLLSLVLPLTLSARSFPHFVLSLILFLLLLLLLLLLLILLILRLLILQIWILFNLLSFLL